MDGASLNFSTRFTTHRKLLVTPRFAYVFYLVQFSLLTSLQKMQAPLFLISLCFLLVSAVFDPNHPHQTKNFDPAEADPSGNITCLGDRYGIDLPIIAGFDPNLVTMQELCAKPQYNGGLPGQHVGAWCTTIMIQRGQRRKLAFDFSPGVQVNAALVSPRVLLGCLLKCYCNSAAAADLIVQPVTTDVALRGNYPQSTSTYEIKIDVVNDFNVPSIQHMGSLVGQLVISVSALLEAQISATLYNYDVTPISVDQQNRIECRGSLPSFPLPNHSKPRDLEDCKTCARCISSEATCMSHFTYILHTSYS